MRTPAGNECAYFYGNYYRGRRDEHCRLLHVSGERWAAALCQTCPVPSILQANACEFLTLRATVNRPMGAFLRRRVAVSAHCEKTSRRVSEPHVGCGECHPLPSGFPVGAGKDQPPHKD